MNSIQQYRSGLLPETRFMCEVISPTKSFAYVGCKAFIDLTPGKLLETLKWHRLFPSFYAAWQKLPRQDDISWQQFDDELKKLVENNRIGMIQKTGRLVQIVKAFEKEGISVIALKGPVLAFQLFGDVGMRNSWDLDILVKPEFLAKAAEILKRLNYRNLFLKNDLTPKQWKYSINHFHHFSFFDQNNCVELHWRLMHLEHLTDLTNDDLWFQPKQIEMAGEVINVLNDRCEFAHLAAHGASHSFFRLGWLYDLKVFRQLHKNDFEMLYHDLESKGCVSLIQTAYACSAIAFGEAEMPIARSRQSFLDHFVKIVRYPESKNFKMVILREYLGKIMLVKGWRKKIKILQIISTSPKDWDMLKLPDKLFFLYFVLRPFLVLKRVINGCLALFLSKKER